MCHTDILHRDSRRFVIRMLAAALLLTSVPSSLPAQDLTSPADRSGSSGGEVAVLSGIQFELTQSVQRLEMIVKTSRVVRLDSRIPRFQVHNEEVVTATPVSESQIQLFAKSPGTTQLNVWDSDDRQYTVDIVVTPDTRHIETLLNEQLPFASLQVTPVGEGAILSGNVTSSEDVERAVAITEQFYNSVINNIKVVGVQQVLLHTKLMEVSRTKLRELGVDWMFSDGSTTLVSRPGMITSDIAEVVLFTSDFEAVIKAMRRDNLIKLLAEPTVVATHGRPARFTVGGELPIIIPSSMGSYQIEYKEYGTSVDFMPLVVGPGRIKLEIRPEVSEPDDARGISINGFSMPAFTTRYVDTSVEMQSGQTFAIAGLLQSRTESQVDRLPLLGELPYAGTLFRRVRHKQNEIELLVTVTPEFVEAMDPHEVPCGGPGLNSASPSDKELFLKGYVEVPAAQGDCPPPHGMIGGSSHHGLLVDPIDVGPGGQEGLSHRHGLIYPSSEPVTVGDGVTVMQP